MNSDNKPVVPESAIERAVKAAEQRKTLKPKWYRNQAMWGIGGLLIGITAAVGWQNVLAPQQASAGSKPFVMTGSAAQHFELPHELQRLIKPAEAPAVPSEPKPEESLAEAASEPVQAVLERPAPQISGRIEPASITIPEVPVLPTVAPSAFRVEAVQPTMPVEQQPVKTSLVEVSQTVEDREAARKHIEAVAKRLGGGAQKVVANGVESVVAFVHPDKVETLIAEAGKFGAAVTHQTWSGDPSARRQKLVADLETRIASLNKQRDEMLKTFYEDAQPVRHLDEDLAKLIEEVQKLKSLKNPGDKAMVRITFS